MTPAFAPTRRRLLGAALSLAALPRLARALEGGTLTVLYERATATAPSWLDPVAQAAGFALQEVFAARGFTVLQPSAEVMRALGSEAGYAVAFAPDAGVSILFSLRHSVLPVPGLEQIRSDVFLNCRVFVGHTVLARLEGRGSMIAATGAGAAEEGRRRSLDIASQNAARQVAERLLPQLRALTPQEIARRASAVLPAPPRLERISLPEPAPGVEDTGPLPPPARRHALIVAVSDYAGVRRQSGLGLVDLGGVLVDAQRVQRALRGRGFAERDIQVLTNAEATSATVRERLKGLVATAQRDDLVLIFISAHGAPANEGPSGFGMPVLSDFGVGPRGALLDFWDLQSLVGNLPALRTALVIDTCHAGGATKLMTQAVVGGDGVSARSGVATDVGAVAQAHTLGTRAFAVMAAAQPDEFSVEDAEGGLFTTVFLDALAQARGPTPLAQLFRERIAPEVVKRSQPLCREIRQCERQTPQFAFSGLGHRLWI